MAPPRPFASRLAPMGVRLPWLLGLCLLAGLGACRGSRLVGPAPAVPPVAAPQPAQAAPSAPVPVAPAAEPARRLPDVIVEYYQISDG